jgi:hypothetical protein
LAAPPPPASPPEQPPRLALAVRLAELVPYVPPPEDPSFCDGEADGIRVLLRLSKGGTLEIRAEPPAALPEELEISRGSGGPFRVRSLNPASGRRLLSLSPELHKSLEDLFATWPHARVADGIVQLSVPPQAPEEQLRRALRAVLHTAWELASASEELAQRAEQNRELARSHVPDPEGSKRFVKLLPSEATRAAAIPHPEGLKGVLREAYGLLLRGGTEVEAYDYLTRAGADELTAWYQLERVLREHDADYQKLGTRDVVRGFATLVLVVLLFMGQESWPWAPRLTFFLTALGGLWGTLGVLQGADRFIFGGQTEREQCHQDKNPDWGGRP